jgi:hypothetical protein
MGAREILLGTPLADRSGEHALGARLDEHLRGVAELVREVYGDSAAGRQAAREIMVVADMADGRRERACKRAMLLFALHSEPSVREHFLADPASAPLARDLCERVIPFALPRFFRHCCQTPDAFVVFCMTLAEMWEGERLGNWPRAP